MTEHEGKTAVVTGGNSGIGRATALALGRQGCRVVIAARDRERGEHVAAEIRGEGGSAEFMPTDVRKAHEVEELMERVSEDDGSLHFLFNNAGYEGPVGPVEWNSVKDVHQIVDTNLKGVFFCVREALPHLADGGCVVNNASFAATIPFEPGALYAATKAGVLHLTRSLAAVYSDRDLRFYGVCPYITDAPMIDRVAEDMGAPKSELAAMNPSGELVRAEDVARVVVDLLTGTRELDNGGALLVDRDAEVQEV